MQLSQIAFGLESAVQAQLRLADPDLASLGGELLEVMRPAIRQALLEVVEMATQEINGQLAGQRVEIRLVDGEPELTVGHDEATVPPPSDSASGAEARITLRLPGYLKELIAEAAEISGESVNGFVVDALRSRTSERVSPNSVRRTIDL